ncbi:MAG: rhomboid family intramembrane serine protease [Planctomycetes bacterium]|nr:rhomboid family intramembrane serine protease [Planctomycetota bacterium]
MQFLRRWPTTLALLVVLAVTVGLTEARFGSLRALLAFLGIHLATLIVLGMTVEILPGQPGSEGGMEAFAQLPDVGPSAGYFGCLGIIVATLTWPGRWWLAAAALGWLVVAVAIPPIGRVRPGPDHVADLAHLLAFGFGLALGAAINRRRRHAESRDSKNQPLGQPDDGG